jgi:hypothetical protein
MKRVTSMATACVAAVILMLGISVGAQDFNIHEKTFLTFSNSVEMPGMTLPAGTYTFKLADTPGRNVVQVLSQDEKQVHGQFLFIPAERPEVTGDTVITFRETREGTTPAIQYWYYPGEKIGKEFIYAKDQAMRIAARTGATVMTEAGPVSANSTASSTDGQGQVTEWRREQTTTEPTDTQVAGTAGISQQSGVSQQSADVSSQQSVGGSQQPADVSSQQSADVAQQSADLSAQSSDVAAAEPAPAQQRSSVARAEPAPAPDDSPEPVGTSGTQDARPESIDARAELPSTASPLALSGLIGLLSLAGAIGLRAFRG